MATGVVEVGDVAGVDAKPARVLANAWAARASMKPADWSRHAMVDIPTRRSSPVGVSPGPRPESAATSGRYAVARASPARRVATSAWALACAHRTTAASTGPKSPA